MDDLRPSRDSRCGTIRETVPLPAIPAPPLGGGKLQDGLLRTSGVEIWQSKKPLNRNRAIHCRLR